MSELRIPLAFDEQGRLCSPKNAKKGKNYFCPCCRKPVILKKGSTRTAHFAHKADNTCNQETVIHKTAKLLIQRIINEWKSGKSDPPLLQRKCPICQEPITQSLPEQVENAILEYKLTNGSIVDIALLVKGKVRAAIEIKVTHPVEELKSQRLPVPFIELDGHEVIKNPIIWKPITDKFKPIICKNCKQTYLEFRKKAEKIAKNCNLTLPETYYRYGICKCWKCKREIIVFAWPKGGLHNNLVPKQRPIPRTIQYRFSKTIGAKYWVNTCPYCKSIQGDFYLHAEPDGPFFGITIEEDSQTAFEEDSAICNNKKKTL